MIHLLTVACAVALTLSASASAQLPPLEFKGLPLGASEADLMARFPRIFSCKNEKAPMGYMCTTFVPGETSCKPFDFRTGECNDTEKELHEYGGIKPRSYWLQLKDDKVARVSVSFRAIDFSTLAAALSEKYGKPTKDERATVKNRMGAEFENRTMIWDRADGSLRIQQRGGSIDTGLMTMSAAGVAERDAEEQAERAKAAAKKL